MASKFLSTRRGSKPSEPRSGSVQPSQRTTKVSSMITKPGAKGGCAPCAARRKGQPNG